METTDQNLATLASYLEHTLNPDPNVRRKAERDLEQVEANQGYARLLLALLGKATIQMHIRLAAAVTFKNFVKRNWRIVEGDLNRICDADRDFIKWQIVDLMLTSTELVQRQLSEAVSLIGREDFPAKWPTLLNDMVARFQTGDFSIIGGVLQTAHSLFKRYRHEMKSNELWSEIKFVLDTFAAPLTELLRATIAYATANSNDAAAMKNAYNSLVLIAKVFYSLNYQDLPEFFEDNMQIWMPVFLELLQKNVQCLETDDSSEAGIMEHLKAQICENVSMYAQKYEEEFQPYMQTFVETIWHLLVTTGPQPKKDILVSSAIQFLACVCERPQYKSIFDSGSTLAQICERVIVPNMEFRVVDEELFQDNPEEYIRKDLEGSDIETRRRAACDFVRALCQQFEPAVIQIFSQYVQQMLAEYAAAPQKNWAKKDAAVYLVTSLAAKGATARLGTTHTSELVNVVDFFRSHVVPDLAQQPTTANAHPVLLADALKFVITFRQQLGKVLLIETLPVCVRLLGSESVVVQTYAAHAVERMFTLKGEKEHQPLISSSDVQPFAGPLLNALFSVLGTPQGRENEYVMKCIMRTLSLLQEAVLPFADVVAGQLTAILIETAKNPTKPYFNHFMFESFCVLIRLLSKVNPHSVDLFEKCLFPPFEDILKRDVTEFLPYVFQLLGMMLDLHEIGHLPTAYLELFPFLLMPQLWERQGNVPALVKLLQAYIKIGPTHVVKHLNPVLGVFQKLIASKANDHEGFHLLNSIIEHIEITALQNSLKGIMLLLFQRMQSSKTAKFVKGFLVSLSLLMIKAGPESTVAVCDQIQPNMFGMVLEKIIIVDLQKVSGSTERKICQVGMTRLLTECSSVTLAGKYSQFWVSLLQALVALFELPEEDAEEDEHFAELEEINGGGYSSAYSQLAFATKKEHDPTGVSEPKLFLAKSLERLAQTTPGHVKPLVEKLDSQAKQYLHAYLLMAGVALT